MSTKRNTKHRRQRGNLIILTCFSFLFLGLCVVVGYSFCGAYWLHHRLQVTADEICLAGAKKLNYLDRIGQMNNMVARCRQLVSNSRDDFEKTKQDYPELASFAEPLLDEARSSASELENQRVQLSGAAVNDCYNGMQDKLNSLKPTYPMSLPWLQIGELKMLSYGCGRYVGMESSVAEMTQLDKLRDNDRSQNLVSQNAGGVSLYKGELNHPLPSTDSDLRFFLSSLPPCIGGQVSPAYCVESGHFALSNGTPSVMQITICVDVKTSLGFVNVNRIRASSMAVTTGASKQL